MLLIIISLIFTYLLGLRLWQWSSLRHVRGPVLAGFTDFWMLKRIYVDTLFDDLKDVCEQYGSLVRIAPNTLICGDPTEVKRMWSLRSNFDRSPSWYKGFQVDPPNDCTLTLTDSKVHTALRSKLANGASLSSIPYSGKGVEGLHEIIDGQIARFIKLIEEKYLSTETVLKPMDFAKKAQYLTLDIISTIAFGRTFGFMDKDGDLFDYIKITEKAVPLMQWIALIPWLTNVLQSRVFKFIAPSDTDTVGLGKIMGIAKEVVAERYGDEKITRPDMLGSFVSHGLSQKEAESESLVQIIAGSDTTVTALRMTLLHIITSPIIYRKLQNEIDLGIASGEISSPIADVEARKMPFLQACIKEGIRICPPINATQPKISNEDEILCGKRVPKGTNVGWSAKAVLRDIATFGEDSDPFWPDRWVNEGDAQKLLAMEQTVELVFGRGKWGCLGKPIAMLELNKMFVEILRRFDFTIVNPTSPMKSWKYGVAMQREMYMRISAR